MTVQIAACVSNLPACGACKTPPLFYRMKLSEQVICAIDDSEAGKFDAALLHACILIDATSKRLYPSEQKVGVRMWIAFETIIGFLSR